jgi:hypothetical protein
VPLGLFIECIDVTHGMTQRINGELKLIWKLFVFGLLGDNDLQPDWTGILQRLQVRRTILQAESLTV